MLEPTEIDTLADDTLTAEEVFGTPDFQSPYKQVAACMAWLAPVCDTKVGGDGAIHISNFYMAAHSPQSAALARQDAFKFDAGIAVPEKIMRLIKWESVESAHLTDAKTRLVVTYHNGDTVRVPVLGESGATEFEFPDLSELEWQKFGFFDALAFCASVAENDGSMGAIAAVHFVAGILYSTNRYKSRLRRAVTGVDYGSFCMPTATALYLSKIGNDETEFSTYGSVEWTDRTGAVIGEGPSAIAVRNGDDFMYTSQVLTSAPFPWAAIWDKAEFKHNCTIGDGLSHYMTLIAALAEAGQAPAATLRFEPERIFVTSGEDVVGSAPITYQDGIPPFEITLQLTQWSERKGELEVAFGASGDGPMIVHSGAGLETAIMPMGRKGRVA